jgi:hypothetical protein
MREFLLRLNAPGAALILDHEAPPRLSLLGLTPAERLLAAKLLDQHPELAELAAEIVCEDGLRWAGELRAQPGGVTALVERLCAELLTR